MKAVENPGHIAQQVNLTPSSEEGDSFSGTSATDILEDPLVQIWHLKGVSVPSFLSLLLRPSQSDKLFTCLCEFIKVFCV